MVDQELFFCASTGASKEGGDSESSSHGLSGIAAANNAPRAAACALAHLPVVAKVIESIESIEAYQILTTFLLIRITFLLHSFPWWPS